MKTNTQPKPQVLVPHLTHPALLDGEQGPVRVALAGVGGSGSRMLPGLACLDRALRALGHPGGLDVISFDPDLVSESNVGRQLFYTSDVGQNKAVVLTDRVNMAHGLAWRARPEPFGYLSMLTNFGPRDRAGFDLLITCVDSARARREIHRGLQSGAVEEWRKPCYWLDLGNRQTDGQVVLGEVRPRELFVAASMGADAVGLGAHAFHRIAEERLSQAQGEARARDMAVRLPSVIDLNPEILDENFVEDEAPSCSLAQALERQDLFINQHVATWALELLWKLFRRGRLTHHAAYINLDDGRVRPRLVPSMVPQVLATPKKKHVTADLLHAFVRLLSRFELRLADGDDEIEDHEAVAEARAALAEVKKPRKRTRRAA